MLCADPVRADGRLELLLRSPSLKVVELLSISGSKLRPSLSLPLPPLPRFCHAKVAALLVTGFSAFFAPDAREGLDEDPFLSDDRNV